ncbi:MAG: GntR family transcriptional regulator [Bryobacteraceae bacterium]
MISTVPGEAVLAIRPDKSSGTPVYLQIAEGIREILKRGLMSAGTVLPPERILCEQYGVSRMTLRQAFDVLNREGLIETQRGRGTFVSPKRLAKQQQEMRSFTEEIRARGGAPSSQLVSLLVQKATAEARHFFGDPMDDRVFEIQRLRFSDGEPLALETVQIPCRLCPNLDRFDLANHSLYKILEENYGLMLTHCVEEISAARPERMHKKLLGAPTPVAVLVIKRKTYAAEVPVEFGTTVYRAEAYSAIVRSVRAQS